MDLHERMKQDVQTITSNSTEFGQAVILASPESDTLTVNALVTVHHTGFDTDGIRVNTKMASVAVSEQLLIDGLYPYKTIDGEVAFKNHTAVFNSVKYSISEWYPDETVELIVLILTSHEQD